MHDIIKKNRNDVQKCLDNWETARVTWCKRAEAWEKGQDISVEELKTGWFTYSTTCRYEVTVTSVLSGTETYVIDLRTPQGRSEALQDYENMYQKAIKNGGMYLGRSGKWENGYNEYIHSLKMCQAPKKTALLRQTLLHGVPKLYWSVTSVRRLPN